MSQADTLEVLLLKGAVFQREGVGKSRLTESLTGLTTKQGKSVRIDLQCPRRAGNRGMTGLLIQPLTDVIRNQILERTALMQGFLLGLLDQNLGQINGGFHQACPQRQHQTYWQPSLLALGSKPDLPA